MLLFRLFFALLVFVSSLSAEHVQPDTTLMIPMRDGTELPTDIYLPHTEAKNLPCILLRGPAGRKSQSALYFIPLAKAGYIVAIQDTRAATDSEGKTLPYHSDGWGTQKDGFDTVEWLAKHELTNGNIGTLGVSNMGITQILMAPTAPSGLKCQYIGVAAASLYHHAIFPGGRLLKNQVEGWLGLYAKDPAVLKFVLDQPDYNDFWEGFNSLKMAHRVQAPAVHQGGWFDTFLQGTIDAFVARQELGGDGARGKQKLLIGPWVHRWPATMELGEFQVPTEGRAPPQDLSPQRWFDHYLKGYTNGITDAAPVTYYVMGPFDGSPSSGNVWRTAETWPVPHVDTAFYLTDKKELVERPAAMRESTLTYTHNPDDPVPTIGGRNLFLDAGPMDQRPIEQRKDVLVFTTAPLAADVEVTGRILAKLVFSSDQNDTDVAVRLTDVYPDGRSILIADAIYRTGTTKAVRSDRNTKEIDVDLWSTSIVFAKGHRIRLSIAGSNYPRFEKNGSSIHQHQLHVGGQNPSRLILPLVRKGDHWLADNTPSTP